MFSTSGRAEAPAGYEEGDEDGNAQGRRGEVHQLCVRAASRLVCAVDLMELIITVMKGIGRPCEAYIDDDLGDGEKPKHYGDDVQPLLLELRVQLTEISNDD